MFCIPSVHCLLTLNKNAITKNNFFVPTCPHLPLSTCKNNKMASQNLLRHMTRQNNSLKQILNTHANVDSGDSGGRRNVGNESLEFKSRVESSHFVQTTRVSRVFFTSNCVFPTLLCQGLVSCDFCSDYNRFV